MDGREGRSCSDGPGDPDARWNGLCKGVSRGASLARRAPLPHRSRFRGNGAELRLSARLADGPIVLGTLFRSDPGLKETCCDVQAETIATPQANATSG